MTLRETIIEERERVRVSSLLVWLESIVIYYNLISLCNPVFGMFEIQLGDLRIPSNFLHSF